MGLGFSALLFYLDPELPAPEPEVAGGGGEPDAAPSIFNEGFRYAEAEFWALIEQMTTKSTLASTCVDDYLYNHGPWVSYVRVKERDWYRERTSPDF